MNDAPDTRGSSSTSLTLMGFALGAAVGAGLALLLAPASGRRTRQHLASTARRWSESAGHTVDQARDTVTELGTDARSAIKAGQDAFLHDRATRDSRSDRRRSHAASAEPGANAGNHSGDEAAR